jgi:hypothetical protein
MKKKQPRQSVEIYFGSLAESVKRLAREIKYREPGNSLSSELRPVLLELMRRYGVNANDSERE